MVTNIVKKIMINDHDNMTRLGWNEVMRYIKIHLASHWAIHVIKTQKFKIT